MNRESRIANPPRASDSTRSIYADVAGGITTFFTMAYIVIVNPSILATPGTGMSFSGALTATVLVACSMTLLMGVYARLPFAVAPGMGLNAFFAYTIVLQNRVPWPIALGIVFWAGVLFLLVSATPLRERIATAIPPNLRIAAASGIGLLLTFIGRRNAGLVATDPVTLVRLGDIDHRAAFLLPDLLNYFLAGGALSIAFIPFYTRLRDREGDAVADRFLAVIFGTTGALAVAATFALWLLAEPLVAIQFPRFSPEQAALTARLTRILLPAQIFSGRCGRHWCRPWWPFCSRTSSTRSRRSSASRTRRG